MSRVASQLDSNVELMAAVVAVMSHPFAEEGELLDAWNLSVDEWRRVRASWRERLASEPPFAARFKQCFRDVRRELASGRLRADVVAARMPVPGGDARGATVDECAGVVSGRPLASQAQQEVAAVSPTAAEGTTVDETGVVDLELVERVLRDGSVPFRGASPAPPPALLHDERDAAPSVDETVAFEGVVLNLEATPFDEERPPEAERQSHVHLRVSEPLVSTPGATVPSDAAEPWVGHLTMRQWVALEVELEKGEGPEERVLATFGLSRDVYRAHRARVTQLLAEPATRERYEMKRGVYLQWRGGRNA